MAAIPKIKYATPQVIHVEDTDPVEVDYQYTFTGLTVGKRYRLVVRAVNTAGTPGDPRALTLQRGNSVGSLATFHTRVPTAGTTVQQEHTFIATHTMLKVRYQSNDEYAVDTVLAFDAFVFLV